MKATLAIMFVSMSFLGQANLPLTGMDAFFQLGAIGAFAVFVLVLFKGWRNYQEKER